MAFDLATSLRWLKPEKRTQPLLRRPDHELPFAAAAQRPGPPLLLDTTVYIDVLQGRAPPEVGTLLKLRLNNHSTVALGELTHLFGRLDPAHSTTKSVLDPIRGVIEDDIPSHRLSAPSARAVADAGIVTGTMARLNGLPKVDKQPFMNDASLFLQALENGWTLLSRNIADMDLIDQLVPGLILLYRQIP